MSVSLQPMCCCRPSFVVVIIVFDMTNISVNNRYSQHVETSILADTNKIYNHALYTMGTTSNIVILIIHANT